MGKSGADDIFDREALSRWRANTDRQPGVDQDNRTGKTLQWDDLPDYQSTERLEGSVPANKTFQFMRKMPWPPLKSLDGVDEIMALFTNYMKNMGGQF